MFGQFSGQEQANRRLDLSAGDGGTLVVVRKSGGLSSYSLEDVVDEAVHDGHGLAGDASVGMYLLQNFVDVDRETLLPPLLLLFLVRSPDGFLGLSGFFYSLA